MPTTTLLPVGTVQSGPDWSAVGGATFEEVLASDDGAASYAACAVSLPEVLEVTMAALPANVGAIQSVTVRASTRGAGVTKLKVFARGTVDGAAAINVADSVGFITTSGALPRPGGGAWNRAALAAVTCAIAGASGGAGSDISFVAWDVAWTPSTSLGANQSGQGIDRAYLTARSGWARADASRVAFAPTATQGTTPAAGLAPGSAGGYYVWRRRYLPSTVWTPVRPPLAQR
jgi:hypothetical protein